MSFTDHLKKLQMVHLATIEADQPRLRPMTMIYWQQRFWFATGSQDRKAIQLKANPKAEWCLIVPGEDCTGYLKGSGVMRTETDPAIRKALADYAQFLYDYWKDASDPDFVLYEMQISELKLMLPGAMLEQDVTDKYLIKARGITI
ncbi:MAG TPA: pyridoxamine 5'-phosphate oxidase family protein [Candidatus Cloacimonadota bacterium]|nr:pyridoxamine 5'-phosphate oxidase family protein [Candidatus Cloacimonadota bacterium]